MADMIVYYDTEMMTYFNKHVISDETILIGFRHRDTLDHTVERCNYYGFRVKYGMTVVYHSKSY